MPRSLSGVSCMSCLAQYQVYKVVKKIFIMLVLFFLSASQAGAECGTVNNLLAMDLPAVSYAGQLYHIVFSRYLDPNDPANIYFKLDRIETATAQNSCALVDEHTFAIAVQCAEYAGVKYTLQLEFYKVEGNNIYWRLSGGGYVGAGGNHPPVADAISLASSPSTPYVQQQLSGRDSDNDIITYELMSPATGNDYSAAYLNPNSGVLYFTVSPGAASFLLTYRVTDGLLYSEPATVSIEVANQDATTRGTGAEDVSPELYASFKMSGFNSNLLGTPQDAASRPDHIDLSMNFPLPGDQGKQNSCVGWAVAYALKSFQEKVENNWELNDSNHLFSPSFVYNQLNDGHDRGTSFNKALDLAVNTGLTTLDQMPYNVTDYQSQPSATALAEAANFKAKSWAKVSDGSQIFAALVNRQPVLCGIRIYPSFSKLKGENSVYNTKDGALLGGHAVTIVGYDDNRLGGAYKLINSYGQNWGDNGYFWLPYTFASDGILTQAYILEDRENTPDSIPAPVTPTVTEPAADQLPNLVVSSWNIPSYDPRPRGAGTLMYTVANTGAGPAPAGADVNLMLSANPEISSNDYYVIYETIPFDLNPGETVYRDEGNALSFQLPDQLSPGIYYIAMWVDDLDVVQEMDENDNVSMGDGVVTIVNHLPDLMVDSWYADWNEYGIGQLTYKVINNGASATTNTDWYVNLILDRDQQVGNGNEIYLFYEQTGFLLNPGEYLYRDGSSTAPAKFFSLYTDYDGQPVPPGVYYMGLWVDDLNVVEESNELNNGSYSWGTVAIQGLGAGQGGNTLLSETSATENARHLPTSAYNGRRLPPENRVMRKVEITKTKSGLLGMSFLPDDKDKVPASRGSLQAPIRTKHVASAISPIFPTTRRRPMHGGEHYLGNHQ